MSLQARAGADRQQRILDAVLALLAEQGIAGVSMRAVAKKAGVSLGLVNYHYDDKVGLVRAALERFEEQDLALLDTDPSRPAAEQVRTVLRRVVSPEFLAPDYLALRLHLWSLAQVHEEFADVNTTAQQRYRARLRHLIALARPDLDRGECARRADDVSVVQNGIWLSALLGLDPVSVGRSADRCEAIALGDGGT